MKIALRPHQQELKSAIYHEYNQGHRKVIAMASCGFGKTFLSASIIHDAVAKGIRCIFSVPTLTLCDQAFIEMGKAGLDCGIIQSDNYYTDYSKPVQILSIQTLASQLKRGNKAEIFQLEQYFKDVFYVQDECHIQFKAAKWLMDHTSKQCLGVSGSPWSKGLGLIYDSLVSAKNVRWLIENGYLSKYTAYSHYQPDMKNVPTNANGDYSLKATGEKYTPKIIGSIVGEWERLAKGRQTLLFTSRVVDAERFAKEFRDAGYSAVAVSGIMDNEDCKAEINRFRNHEVTIICSVDKLSVGLDVTDIGAIIDARPTKSKMNLVQRLFRGMRIHPGKEDVILIDSAGNFTRHPLPDGGYPTTLDMGNNEKIDRTPQDKEKLPKPCPKCQFMKPPKVHICPSCQFAPEKQSQVEIEAGELVEIKSAMAKRNRDMSWEEKQLFITELKRHAHDRGYKEGWIYPNYKAYTGVLPFDRRLKNLPMADTIRESTQRWITSQQIRYANRRTA